MPQPEAPRGSDGIPPIFLPIIRDKKGIHQRYIDSCEGRRACTQSIVI